MSRVENNDPAHSGLGRKCVGAGDQDDSRSQPREQLPIYRQANSLLVAQFWRARAMIKPAEEGMKHHGTIFMMAAAGLVWAQPRPAFEIASIKPNNTDSRRSVQFSPETLTMLNLPLANILFQAYELAPEQYSLGEFEPLFRQRYDIVAKSAGPVPQAQMRLMLQSLLADRFQLVSHRESRMEQAYALVVDKGGHKLNPPAAPNAEADFDKRVGNDSTRQSITFRNAGMPLVASIVRETADMSKVRAGAPPIIVDMTGLRGGFDFTFEWTREETPSGENEPPDRLPAIAGALHKVGLALRSQKVSIDTLVVDHIAKTPTEN